MNPNDFTHLNWVPVILLKVTQIPFLEASVGLMVQRAYLTEHPDGILRADWTLPADERIFPLVQLVGWQPGRDVPFTLPVKFRRQGDPRIGSILPSGTWVLPYDETLYRVYEQMRTALTLLITVIEATPADARLWNCLIRIIAQINLLNRPFQK